MADLVLTLVVEPFFPIAKVVAVIDLDEAILVAVPDEKIQPIKSFQK